MRNDSDKNTRVDPTPILAWPRAHDDNPQKI